MLHCSFKITADCSCREWFVLIVQFIAYVFSVCVWVRALGLHDGCILKTFTGRSLSWQPTLIPPIRIPYEIPDNLFFKAMVSYNTTLLSLSVCARLCVCVCGCVCVHLCAHCTDKRTQLLSPQIALSQAKVSQSQGVSVKAVWKSIDTSVTVCGLKFLVVAKWPWGKNYLTYCCFNIRNVTVPTGNVNGPSLISMLWNVGYAANKLRQMQRK